MFNIASLKTSYIKMLCRVALLPPFRLAVYSRQPFVRYPYMYERDRKLLEYFDGLGIRPGVRATVVEQNYDGTLSLRLGEKGIVLGEAAARRVWVLPDR